MSALPVLTPVSVSRLVSATGAELPLRACTLRTTAAAGLARVTVEQVFANASDVALEVTYQLPLPADAAVAGFSFRLQDRVVRGEIAGREAARARYERALFEGRTAALLEQDRTSLFTQAVGNVPPRSEITVVVEIDQPLRWETDGWCWRFPTVVGPRYVDEGVTDAARLAIDVADGPLTARLSLHLEIGDARTGAVRSSTHALTHGEGAITLSGGAARLDRDVVITWPVAADEPGATLVTARTAAGLFGMLTLMPPRVAKTSVPRDVILLLDVSGSMGGEPLDMLRATCRTIVDGLRRIDSLEMIAFASEPTRWRRAPAACDDRVREDAHRWLRELRAGGSTEMDRAIREAFASVRDGAQRQVIVITDGYIGFEDRVVATALAILPADTRIHTVGVGHAPNRALTRPLARVGRGQEILPTGADLNASIARLCAHLDAPQIVDVTIDGDAVLQVAPARLPDLYEGAPARLSLQLKAGTLRVRGRAAEGPWERVLVVPEQAESDGGALARLHARERVADLETTEAAEHGQRQDDAIEQLGLVFGIVTRRTSLVAVSETITVDPGAPTRRVLVPHELPAGTTVDGMGLRSGAPFLLQSTVMARAKVFAVGRGSAQSPSSAPSPPPTGATDPGLVLADLAANMRRLPTPAAPERRESPPTDVFARPRHMLVGPSMLSAPRLSLVRSMLSDGVLLVVLEVLAPLSWRRTKTIVVTVGRRTRRLPIEATMTTADAALGAGQVLRLAIRVPADLGAVISITAAGETVLLDPA